MRSPGDSATPSLKTLEAEHTPTGWLLADRNVSLDASWGNALSCRPCDCPSAISMSFSIRRPVRRAVAGGMSATK